MHARRGVARRGYPAQGVTAGDEAPAGVTPRKNRYLPNNPEEEFAFRWWLHFFGGRAPLMALHVMKLERQYQKSLDQESRDS